ncbi:histidine kinase N-terminal 7TM domain-containing protein [Halopenitus persicus]|uniref:histidine kinase n=1 Tax=Halopenitus persicus TaxID=1048396 RepID=A0A1H3LYL7_9EURY|nr:histidine kinase N-terminal 7TM domain-containing protein [Halopenitus persicus]SDY69500.1 PAS domain-containing protein [Halopenitus persicus]
MVGVATLPWPAIGSVAAGIGSLALIRYVLDHRGTPGANWFIAVLLAQAVWCLGYGVGLFVFDPRLRLAFEAVVWLGIVWTGLTFLAFALEYTGRGDVVRGAGYGAFAAFGVVTTVLTVTNQLHGAMWSGFGLDPVLGVATVTYAIGAWGYLTLGVATLSVVVAVVLLVDTLLSYGPLYRREAAAVALSSIPPGFALLAWAFGVGPVPQLNLAPVMFLPHVALDAYAFGRADLFERNPTTIRTAERTAIDDLADPIAIVDLDERIVRLNDAATAAFGGADGSPLDRQLTAVVGADVDLPSAAEGGGGETGPGTGGGTDDGAGGEPAPGTIEHRVDGRDRTYAVSASRLRDPAGTHVGYTVVFTDITEQERRRQQLEVLNRILRHNLRNDAGVVHGYAELLVDRVDEDDRRMADAIERRAGALAALGEKARTVETLIDGEPSRRLSVDDLVRSAVADVRNRDRIDTADVDLSVTVNGRANGGTDGSPEDEASGGTDGSSKDEANGVIEGEFREATLTAAVTNLVENAIRHHDGNGSERPDGAPWVRVTVALDGDDVVVTVADDGPGIPDHELETIAAGEETALEHGSGLGLWIVHWASDALGGTITYTDRSPRGTRAELRLPGGKDDPRR